MLAILGFLTIAIFLYSILSKRLSVIVALVLVPIIFGIIGGFGLELGEFMLEGLQLVAPTGVMLGFAILYFGVLSNAGMFDPILSRILKIVKGDPLKVVIGTLLFAMIAQLDGSGASTFLIVIPALLPLYDRLGMSRIVLAGMVGLGAGLMNIMPWGGPTARAGTAIGIDPGEVFIPLLPSMGIGFLWLLFVAYWVGKKEQKRLGIQDYEYDLQTEMSEEERGMRRPKLFIPNVLLTILTLTTLVMQWLPLPVVFIVAFVIALMLNYPKPDQQMDQIQRQAKGAIPVLAIIFAAGIFTGILTGTGMIDAMALALVSVVPDGIGGSMPALVALISVPLSLVFNPDAYYFGVMPILAQSAEMYGVPAIEIAQASVLGQMTVGFPLSPLTASTFLLIGLAQVELADHQRFMFKWAFLTTIVMAIFAILTGVISAW
ncbi:CitMHS family transporter [Geomicrobium sediminis]|uniref:CitMHS family citrate-Mg2+:H+ or citrate-Ca2+:H+ symporter n=1 Tax=Geomicrobium sediminis TaxID=1347788 RepID=A0ABS2PCG5_9BACL|nr:citrate:proton symporter [Geomicrobium sediminis]MBM7633098.1 CitMHS family citrate-Mg2+:H+ or citrate-Ca2+:H+ symporter [Geomicrobium sediminis]